MTHPDADLMRRAIDLGRGETGSEAVAALVVADGEVVARSRGAIFDRPDATAHSEVEAIRAACRALDRVHLDGCWLYTTHEPCPMCAAACCWARLDGIVSAATDADMPDAWGTIFAGTPAGEIVAAATHRPALHEEFLRDEAASLHDHRD